MESSFSTILIVSYAIANLAILHFVLYYQRSVRRKYNKGLWKKHRSRA